MAASQGLVNHMTACMKRGLSGELFPPCPFMCRCHGGLVRRPMAASSSRFLTGILNAASAVDLDRPPVQPAAAGGGLDRPLSFDPPVALARHPPGHLVSTLAAAGGRPAAHPAQLWLPLLLRSAGPEGAGQATALAAGGDDLLHRLHLLQHPGLCAAHRLVGTLPALLLPGAWHRRGGQGDPLLLHHLLPRSAGLGGLRPVAGAGGCPAGPLATLGDRSAATGGCPGPADGAGVSIVAGGGPGLARAPAAPAAHQIPPVATAHRPARLDGRRRRALCAAAIGQRALSGAAQCLRALQPARGAGPCAGGHRGL